MGESPNTVGPFLVEGELFLAQPSCHAQGMKLDESKLLSERKNLERMGS